MATQTTLTVWFRRFAIAVPALLAGLISLFLLAAWIGSSIPRNSGWEEPDTGITIMVETNGVHTAIVMPLVTPQKDWREDFPADDLLAPTRPYTHISVSWGEREVFLNTPTWWDLSLGTALNAASGGKGLLHVSHYVRPAPSPDHREITIRHDEYAALITLIERQVLPAHKRRMYPGYADYDVFYQAPGSYHLGNTCNQWTSDTLAAAGIRTGWWTPLAGGVMKWVPRPPER